MGVRKATVGREIRRNREGKGYRPTQAHQRARDAGRKLSPELASGHGLW